MHTKTFFALSAIFALSALSVSAKVLMIDNFDQKSTTNLLEGKQNVWSANPDDRTQGCLMKFSDDEVYGSFGSSLYLHYSVAPRSPSSSGFWMKLKGVDARAFNSLVFFAKGDIAAGYPTSLKLELKNASETGTCAIEGIVGQWEKITIPFTWFQGIRDFSSLSELVFVFDPETEPATGGIYIDEMCFSDGVGPEETAASAQQGSPLSSHVALWNIMNEAKKEGLEVRSEEKAVVITVRIQFDSGTAALVNTEKEKIREVAALLKKHMTVKMRVEGYTDSKGSAAYNKALALRRARSVVRELTGSGIPADRLSAVGRGEKKPVASNRNEAGRARNRRVEFVITEQ